jgi:hypothetical protein
VGGTYRERLPLEGLQDEVADYPPIVHVHARPKGVEDSCHSHFHTFLEQKEEEVRRLSSVCRSVSAYPEPCIKGVGENSPLFIPKRKWFLCSDPIMCSSRANWETSELEQRALKVSQLSWHERSRRKAAGELRAQGNLCMQTLSQ